MVWARKSVPATSAEQAPLLIGLDLNATRVQAVHGLAQMAPRALTLDQDQDDLAMVLSLEGRHPQVGRGAAGLCRQSPHLVCLDFLASLGEPREWVAGRHRLNATKAIALVLDHLRPVCADARGIVLAVPGYLTRAQVAILTPLVEKARLPLLGSVKTPLAAALAAHAVTPWSGMALVVDADDHALTAATVVSDGGQIWIHAGKSWPQTSLRVWKLRLLDMVADRCVRQSRRDPRDCASAEQSLYEQIDVALDTCGRGALVELLIQTTQWYQNLLLRPEEIAAYCERLVRQAIGEIQALLAATSARETLRIVLLSRAAARLPGLAQALQALVQEEIPTAEPEPSSEDFGDDLLQASGEPALVTPLSADAVARAAHELAVRIQRGELPRGHLELTVPLPKSDAQPADIDARKAFRLFSADPDH